MAGSSPIQEVEWEGCLLERRHDPDAERRFRRATGRPLGGGAHLLGVPWIEEALLAFSLDLETRVALDAELADLAGLVVSQDNSCRYCFAAMRAFLRILGMPAEKITRLERDLLTADFSPRDRTALRFARRLSRSDPICGADEMRALREAGFAELEATELAAVAALNLFFNRVSTMVALPPQEMEALPDRWTVRLARPLLRLQMLRVRRRARPAPLRPDERQGPFSAVVTALDGLPLARSLRAALDGMLDSPVLPRRTKLLVVAVVGRTLGCPCSLDESARLLAADGMEREQLDAVLAHLAGPELDPVEQQLVPFARETVWYEPARIQRRGRELLRTLSREQFIELVVVAALANVLCRLGYLTESTA
jgi:uncharacterized peroxidase-related enzyme